MFKKIKLRICILEWILQSVQKYILSPWSPLNEEKNEEIKPTSEGLYFMIALGNKLWYVGC